MKFFERIFQFREFFSFPEKFENFEEILRLNDFLVKNHITKLEFKTIETCFDSQFINFVLSLVSFSNLPQVVVKISNFSSKRNNKNPPKLHLKVSNEIFPHLPQEKLPKITLK